MMAAEEEAGEGDDLEAAADERLSARPAPGPGKNQTRWLKPQRSALAARTGPTRLGSDGTHSPIK